TPHPWQNDERETMTLTQRAQATRVDQFFTGAEARMDRWRHLLRLAREWQAASKQGPAEQPRSKVENALAELQQWEDFFAYPGQYMLSKLKERIDASDSAATVGLAQSLSTALLTHSYRTNPFDWSDEEEERIRFADRVPGSEDTASHRPYFEVLVVSPSPASAWAELKTELRKLRRADDKF